MLEFILDKRIIYVLIGVFAAIGVVSKCVSNVSLKKLVRAAGNMSKSTHPLMRLVRAKFEHACMVSEKVENVRVFVDKFLYEYKVMGVRLYTLRRMETVSAAVCLVLGVLGAVLEYTVNGMQEQVIRTGATGGIMAVLLYLFHLTTDENFRMEMIKNYMVDYLENVCLHKYEKVHQKEKKVMEEEAFEISEESPIDDNEVESVRQRPEVEIPTPRVKPEIPKQPNSEPYRTPDVTPPIQAMRNEQKSMKNEQRTAKQEDRTPVIKPEKPDRDALIRQILEEFMA